MRKRFISVLLAVCMVFMLAPTMAFAEGGVEYLCCDENGKNWQTETITAYTTVTADDLTWGDDGNDGWYVATGSVTIEDRVTVSGNVHLILADGCLLTVNGGIQVQDDDNDPETASPNNLTIYGQSAPVLNTDGTVNETNNRTGKLISDAGSTSLNAGIGGDYRGDSISGGNGGTITINGGIVKASSYHASGIGGGCGYPGGTGGTITINGGAVIANSYYGSGIGSGTGHPASTAGIITINGGVVTASSSYLSAAIGGGGSVGALSGDGGKITITGGTVTANGNNSPGIGGGGGPNDHSGTFLTTNNGSAVIFATSIGDNDDKTAWRGVIFEGNEGKVYGSAVTPSEDFTIPAGKTLTIAENQTLIIPEGKTLTNEGTIDNSGKIFVDGTLTGTVSGDGMVYCRLTVNGGMATGTPNLEQHDGKTYATVGSAIILSPDTPTTGYSLDKWSVLPSSVTVDANNSFTMPSTPLEITAHWKDIQKPVITGLESNKTYCDTVEFEVSDNDGVASVTANGVPLTPDANNKYTLEKGKGTVTVVATDNVGNPSEVTVTVNNGHTGGEATCTRGAECNYCGDEYGELDRSNHTGTKVWEQNETQHKQYWDCCNAVAVNYEDHTWNNGVCSVCNYNCAHKDTDKDHICDYGCSVAIGTHEDTNTDHKCDYGCSTAIGEHKDVNKDHKCDYGCSTAIGEHKDVNKDHKCDYGCSTVIGAHADVNKDHKCDYGCSTVIGEHKDVNKDHKCDYGCSTAIGAHEDVNKNHKCDICGETISQHSGGEATCTSKAVCKVCEEEYGEYDSTNHNLENIPEKAATVTETGNIEYWHCKDCDKFFADENGTKEIKLDDTITQKLPPEIIEGKGQNVTEGEAKALIFRSNAAFGDFIRVELDGETVDTENYTVEEGSTVVTLKADFVATLSVGEHTIGIVSESGTASAAFTVNENDNSPETGDNSNMALLFALIFISGGLITFAVVCEKNKKHIKTGQK